METVQFRRMKDGTREEYLFLEHLEQCYAATLPDRVLSALVALDGGLEGYPVSRLGHSLQSASRAERDGADDDMIVAALVHDIGDMLAPTNHSQLAAAMLRPFVRAELTWIIEQHGLFQTYYYAHHLGGDRNARDRHKRHEWYGACVDFCEKYDQSAFDPDYPSFDLAHFEPLVRKVFTRTPFDPDIIG